MPRRQRPKSTRRLPGRIASLPWWAGLALAGASAVVLYASVETILAPAALSSVWGALPGPASGAAAAVLLICGIAMTVSSLRNRKPSAPARNARPTTAAQATLGLSSREFEALLGEAFRQQGYQLTKSNASGGAGIDMMLRKDRETVLVHSKHWQADRVGVETLGGLQKAMSVRGATGGFVVTAGRFSREAIAFAQQANLRLIDGPVLLGMIVKARASKGSRTVPASSE